MIKSSCFILCRTDSPNSVASRRENVYFEGNTCDYESESHAFAQAFSSGADTQIYAIASAQGDILHASKAVKDVFLYLSEETSKADTVDFSSFQDTFLQSANHVVCALNDNRENDPVKVSLTIAVIEGDLLRVLSVGNTRAVIVRDNVAISITKDHTQAYQFYKEKSISIEELQDHPGREILTQYLGKSPANGELQVDSKVKMKLKSGDELYLFSPEIFTALADKDRNYLLTRLVDSEEKVYSIQEACEKSRREFFTILSLSFKEGRFAATEMAGSTPFAIPTLAFDEESFVFRQNPSEDIASEATNTESFAFQQDSSAHISAEDENKGSFVFQPDTETVTESEGAADDGALIFQPEPATDTISDSSHSGDEYFFPLTGGAVAAGESTVVLRTIEAPKAEKKQRLLLETLRVLCIFGGTVIMGYLACVVLLSNPQPIVEKEPQEIQEIISKETNAAPRKVFYILADNTSVFEGPDLNSTEKTTLDRGDIVSLVEDGYSYHKIETEKGVQGFVLVAMLSEEDPTIHLPLPERERKFEPTPPKQSTSHTREESQKTEIVTPTEALPTPVPATTAATTRQTDHAPIDDKEPDTPDPTSPPPESPETSWDTTAVATTAPPGTTPQATADTTQPGMIG